MANTDSKTPNADALIVLKALEKDAKTPIKKLSGLSITDQTDFENAGLTLKLLKDLGAQAEAKEKSLTAPLTKVIADIKSLFRPFRETVALTEQSVKQKMLAFLADQKKKEAKLLADFESGKIKKVTTVIAKQKELEVINGAAQVRKVWTAIPVDETLTPREFLVPDRAAIKEALKSGQSVPGWKWEQIENIAV
jgi:hypothetical protein